MERTYTYQGYTFHTESELKEARKEAEVISYVRGQADLSNTETVVKLYNKLVEKGTMLTPLGISFLQELRTSALSSGVVSESSLRALPEPVSFEVKEKEKPVTKEKKLMELYRERSRNLAFTVVVLCITIVIMFAIRLFGKDSPFVDYEKKVLNEYAGWKEELTAKEEELRLKSIEIEEKLKLLEEAQAEDK